jgi:hypothetical protein
MDVQPREHSLVSVLHEGRAAWCWGPRRGWLLGDGTDITRGSPAQVAGDLRYREISSAGAAAHGGPNASPNADHCVRSNPRAPASPASIAEPL